jgi:glutathione peroxidase
MNAIFRRCLLAACLAFAAASPALAEDCPPLLRHTMTTLLDEKPESLCQYRGKVLLVVNTASFCGFTSQYEGLEKLQARLRDKGLVVLGFPSNDFGAQEPGSAKEIKEFCEGTYGVRFPMFSKTAVIGGGAHPFYKGLAAATGKAPKWNFHKYLIDRSGGTAKSFESRVGPDDRQLLAEIDALLARK